MLHSAAHPLARWLLLMALLPVGVPQPAPAGTGGATCAAADSLVRLVDFFARNADRLEADGYFGLAIASLALNSGTGISGDCSDAQLVELDRAMARVARLLAQFRVRAVAGGSGYSGVTYREICHPLESLMRRWLRPAAFRWRRFDVSVEGAGDGGGNSNGVNWLTANVKQLSRYNEPVGDVCYRGILASRRKRCSVSPTCRRLFLNSRPASGYQLTHQFMYWIITVDKHCHLKLSNGRAVGQSLLQDACRRAYAEHRGILDAGPTGRAFIDLAIEQAVLCGVLGYRDFFTDATTLLLRRLQNERLGCFDDRISDKETSANATAATTGRKLMHDVLLDGVCSSHTSGLAAAYFALFLRT